MLRRFADSFFFIALLDDTDQFHQRVVAFAEQDYIPIITTRWVLVETANALSTSAGRATVAEFLRELHNDPNVEIVSDSDTLYRRGFELFSGRPDKQWSLTDCISFIVMQDRGIQEALTGDHHFNQAGFVALFR